MILHHQWSKALDDSKQVDVVFLNFAKAFDRVAHNILLQKCVILVFPVRFELI